MEKKYTPSPWEWVITTGEYFRLDSPQGTVIEAMSDIHGSATISSSNENANLISAAPDLLEALTRLTIDCKIAGLHEQAGFDCWISMADQAIAKAYGRE
jgi:hypothetical protein